MKLWIAKKLEDRETDSGDYYLEVTFLGVFSTKEKAEAYALQFEGEVEEVTLDEGEFLTPS